MSELAHQKTTGLAQLTVAIGSEVLYRVDRGMARLDLNRFDRATRNPDVEKEHGAVGASGKQVVGARRSPTATPSCGRACVRLHRLQL